MSQPFLFLPIEFPPQGAALAAPTNSAIPIGVPNEREGVVRPEGDVAGNLKGGKSIGRCRRRAVCRYRRNRPLGSSFGVAMQILSCRHARVISHPILRCQLSCSFSPSWELSSLSEILLPGVFDCCLLLQRCGSAWLTHPILRCRPWCSSSLSFECSFLCDFRFLSGYF